jgi:multidrug transporter EmrE-like cation transporter
MVPFFLIMGVLLNAGAQLMLKVGMSRIGQFEFSFANTWPIGLKVASNPFIMTGIGMYVVSVGVWLMVLSRMEVSMAYPMLSIGYIANALAAYYFLGEPLSSLRMLGIFIIIAGVVVVARSASA